MTSIPKLMETINNPTVTPEDLDLALYRLVEAAFSDPLLSRDLFPFFEGPEIERKAPNATAQWLKFCEWRKHHD